MPDSYRPTLYDFLAHEALEFYTLGRAGRRPRPEDAFELSADSPIFAPAEEFLNWEVETTDAESPTVKAIQLYQDLLRFHAERRGQGGLPRRRPGAAAASATTRPSARRRTPATRRP